LNKGGIIAALNEHKAQQITVDASLTKSIDLDVLEAIQEFKYNAEQEGRPTITFINL
jgi:hypothetical protein